MKSTKKWKVTFQNEQITEVVDKISVILCWILSPLENQSIRCNTNIEFSFHKLDML